MDVKTSRRFTYNREGSYVNPIRRAGVIGGGGAPPAKKNICFYYLNGRCNRNPCRFSHDDSDSQTQHINPRVAKQFHNNCPKNILVSGGSEDRITRDGIRKKLSYTGSKHSLASSAGAGSGESGKKGVAKKTPEKVCDHWLSGNCVKGDECQFLHSWFHGDGFTMLARLDGHKRAVSGIALPLGCDYLYSGSRDGTVQLWNCHTGQCARVINVGAEVGCLICEGPWVFTGIPNVVKAWNIESSAEFSLEGPIGQVYCMVVANEKLFAGVQDGDILVWKDSCQTENPFQLAASLKGHSRAVICLTVGAKRLYSGSMDNTIMVWDLETLEPIMTLDGHADTPMSLLCWDQYLLSCSLDQTIKVWVATEGGNLEVAHTHNEDHGVLALRGMNDPDGKPVLICACDDNSVHLYELPSLMERGRIFSKRQVRAIEIGPHNLFFTGDGTGRLSVWKLLAKPNVEVS